MMCTKGMFETCLSVFCMKFNCHFSLTQRQSHQGLLLCKFSSEVYEVQRKILFIFCSSKMAYYFSWSTKNFFWVWPSLERRHLSEHLLWYIFQSSLNMLHIYNSCWTIHSCLSRMLIWSHSVTCLITYFFGNLGNTIAP